MEGFEAARARLGRFEYDRMLCCSSAGGGLKMVALGLVPELTAKAARLAAASAGAKVVKTYSFEISGAEQREIGEIAPDLVLLCGGTDGGNRDVIVSNARRLADIEGNFAIIAAGNKCAEDELREIFEAAGKSYVITRNVMPVFNTLDIEPARACIKELFIRKIVEAKGLARAQAMASAEIIPTPLAVMYACELLSKGTGAVEGLGDLMAVDLGGATTDVYSMSAGKPLRENIIIKGLPEPWAKRSVEGDLGMRYSLAPLVEASGVEGAEGWVRMCVEDPGIVAREAKDIEIEQKLARGAVEIAVDRHCGVMESSYSPMGEVFSLAGKDLRCVPRVIGIGGAILNSPNPGAILSGALFDARKPWSMRPESPELMLDGRYIMASMGLLSQVEPELALRILLKEIKPIK